MFAFPLCTIRTVLRNYPRLVITIHGILCACWRFPHTHKRRHSITANTDPHEDALLNFPSLPTPSPPPVNHINQTQLSQASPTKLHPTVPLPRNSPLHSTPSPPNLNSTKPTRTQSNSPKPNPTHSNPIQLTQTQTYSLKSNPAHPNPNRLTKIQPNHTNPIQPTKIQSNPTKSNPAHPHPNPIRPT